MADNLVAEDDETSTILGFEDLFCLGTVVGLDLLRKGGSAGEPQTEFEKVNGSAHAILLGLGPRIGANGQGD